MEFIASLGQKILVDSVREMISDESITTPMIHVGSEIVKKSVGDEIKMMGDRMQMITYSMQVIALCAIVNAVKGANPGRASSFFKGIQSAVNGNKKKPLNKVNKVVKSNGIKSVIPAASVSALDKLNGNGIDAIL